MSKPVVQIKFPGYMEPECTEFRRQVEEKLFTITVESGKTFRIKEHMSLRLKDG